MRRQQVRDLPLCFVCRDHALADCVTERRSGADDSHRQEKRADHDGTIASPALSPITHFLVGWTLALAPGLDRRGRACVALAGVAPDLDGIGLVVDLATKNSDSPTELWGAFHHIVGHGITAAVVVTAVVALLTRSPRATVLAFASFHLHVLGDLVGARGPDGDSWPIHYLWPFNTDVLLSWSGQWELNAWPNFVITGACLVLAFWWAWRRGVSPLEVFNLRANNAFVAALHARFGAPK